MVIFISVSLTRYADGRYSASEVWTRVSTAPSGASSVPSTPDLGLPYEVQHFILEMMRRILEEGSFDFAARVIPKVLHDHQWTCSEQVELSQWRTTLPDEVPLPALTQVPGHSLQSALSNAVRIRNAATHRHLCDNDELRKMAQQAGDLMTLYGDVVRQHKFDWLRNELGEWSQGPDSDVKRSKLEVSNTHCPSTKYGIAIILSSISTDMIYLECS
jgi:hypothetical protein